MRIFIRSRGASPSKQYTLVLCDSEMTISIECGTHDPESHMNRLINRVKKGLTESISYLQFIPVGESLMINILKGELSLRKIFPLCNLKYGEEIPNKEENTE